MNRMKPLLSIVSLALLALTCHPGIPIPGSGIYHGAFADFGQTQDQVSLTNIEEFAGLAGKKLAMIGFGCFWGENYFPKEQLKLIRDYGAIPLIYWEPWAQPYELFEEQPAYYYDSILAGNHDDYIKMWADSAKKWGQPMLVSFAPEMNGEIFPWAGYYDPADNGVPEKFAAVYRHVVELVRARGAKSIKWVYQPYAISSDFEDWNTIRNYYPGDSLIDWLGMSAFGARTEDDDWYEPDSVIGAAYAQLDSLNKAKPMMLAQWGVAELPDMGDKAQWLTTAFQSIQELYPRLKAAVYWHEQIVDEGEVIGDLRIDSSTEALQAYKQGVADNYWRGRQ